MSNASAVKNHRMRRKIEAFIEYGGLKCACPGGCNVKLVEHLTLDHIGGKKTRVKLNHGVKGQQHGHKNRKRGRRFLKFLRDNGYPYKDKLRVLCWNCNCSIGAYGYCPHMK